MKKIYNFIRFQDIIGEPTQYENQQSIVRLADLILPLDEICVRLGGHKLESTDHDGLRETSKYLIGTCHITNDVNLAAGTRATNIGFLRGFGNERLIRTFKSLYGERNMHRSEAAHSTES